MGKTSSHSIYPIFPYRPIDNVAIIFIILLYFNVIIKAYDITHISNLISVFPGSCLWLMGWIINIHSDHILRNLRKPGETGYKIPRGKKSAIRHNHSIT